MSVNYNLQAIRETNTQKWVNYNFLQDYNYSLIFLLPKSSKTATIVLPASQVISPSPTLMTSTGVTNAHGLSPAANSMQVSIWWLLQEVTRPKAKVKPTLPKKSGVDVGAIRCKRILVSCFTCTPYDINWNLFTTAIELYIRLHLLRNRVRIPATKFVLFHDLLYLIKATVCLLNLSSNCEIEKKIETKRELGNFSNRCRTKTLLQKSAFERVILTTKPYRCRSPLPISVTRLCDFRKFLVTHFLTKVNQMYEDFLGYFENINFQVKAKSSHYFWATF